MDAAALRASFPVFERTAYLNAGSDGPLPQVAVDAARAALDVELLEGRTYAHFEARGAANAALRAAYASVLGVPGTEIALTTSTSEGVGKALAGLELGPGDEILISDAEHPGLLGPVLAARDRGVAVRVGPLSTLADHVTQQTSAVVCSHVGWLTGNLADPRLGETGVPLVFDGAQSVGAIDVDVRALGCVAYAGAGQKWLCGADGTGMLWIDPDAGIRAAAPAYGAFVDTSLGIESGMHEDARRFDTPTLAREVVVMSVAAAELLDGFGWDALRSRAHALAAGLAEQLGARGRTVGPRDQTTLVAWEDEDPPATSARLAAAGIVIRHLPGTRLLRASVGAWNDEADLERLLGAL
jgi:L-cysteine/cystine lyase